MEKGWGDRLRETHYKAKIERKSGMKQQTIKRVSKRQQKSRTGKLGIVRLAGADLAELRRQCFERDDYCCMNCMRRVAWSESESRVIDDKFSWSNSFNLPVGQMAHIHAKRNGGDILANVRTLCPDCHTKEHAYGKSMKKPCPAKR